MRKTGRYLLFEIQTVTETQGSLGLTESWLPTGKIYGKFVSFSGLERMKAMALTSKTRYQIHARFRSSITTKNRLALGTRTFNIVSIENVNGQNSDMYLILEELPT